jgi:hypothetical protein
MKRLFFNGRRILLISLSIFFPTEFFKFEGKYDWKIKTEILHAMSSINLKKRMDIEKKIYRVSLHTY